MSVPPSAAAAASSSSFPPPPSDKPFVPARPLPLPLAVLQDFNRRIAEDAQRLKREYPGKKDEAFQVAWARYYHDVLKPEFKSLLELHKPKEEGEKRP